jgi:hypothetical protein
MGKKRAQIISQQAFQQAFAETEVIMRLALGKQIQTLIDNEPNEMIKLGLEHARKVVAGEETYDLG